MARLNESIAAPESIENLKRRFVRQNREIARINSIQSLRIRGLEAEVSSLLSENVSLREQVIALSNEVDRLEAAKLFQHGLYDVKAKLDAKLAELNTLVTDLGALPRKFQKSYDEKQKPANLPETRKPSSDLRARAMNSEPQPGDDDGRLPAIVEDKYYPRQTLEPQELQNLINEEQDAPLSADMEEPPISQMDTTHSNIAQEYLERTDEPQAAPTDDSDSDSLPPTLEMRRKRRLNPPTPGGKGGSNRSGDSPTHAALSAAPKSGSKRKFDPEECDQYAAAYTGSDGDFEFSRPAQVSQKPSERIVSEHADCTPNPRKIVGRGRPRKREPPKRKVLEPKSTNPNASSRNRINPASLRGQKAQQRWNGEDENSKPYTELESKVTRRQRDASTEPDSHEPHESGEGGHDMERYIAQEKSATPKNSAARQPKETSEEEDNGSNAPSRTTRRQKSVVSYAEPNLRAKMRRPTSDFTDAVGSGSVRRSSSQAASSIANDDAERSRGNGSRDSDSGDTDLGVLPKDSSANPFGGTVNMVSQRKRRTLPAKGDDPFTDMNHEDELNDSQSARGHGHQKQTGGGSKTAEDHMASRSASRMGQQDSSSSGHGQGDNGSNEESATYHLSKPPPFPPVDARHGKRGQRISARRKSMMV